MTKFVITRHVVISFLERYYLKNRVK